MARAKKRTFRAAKVTGGAAATDLNPGLLKTMGRDLRVTALFFLASQFWLLRPPLGTHGLAMKKGALPRLFLG